jgi:hypothetical protein
VNYSSTKVKMDSSSSPTMSPDLGFEPAPTSPTYMQDEETDWFDGSVEIEGNAGENKNENRYDNGLKQENPRENNKNRYSNNDNRCKSYSSYNSRKSYRRNDRTSPISRGATRTSKRDQDEVIRCLKEEDGDVPERRLRRWFPKFNVIHILHNHDDISFSMDKERLRTWRYDPQEEVENDILDVLRDGCCTVQEVQRRVLRRFRVVRRLLDVLKRRGMVGCTTTETGDVYELL